MKKIIVPVLFILFLFSSTSLRAECFAPENGLYISYSYPSSRTIGMSNCNFYYQSRTIETSFKSEVSSWSGPAVKIGLNVTSHVSLEIGYADGETKYSTISKEIRRVCLAPGQISLVRIVNQTSDFRDIRFINSPEASLVYTFLNSPWLRLYIGGGIRYVWITEERRILSTNSELIYGPSTANSGWRPSLKFGLKFPIYGIVSGSIDFTSCPILVDNDPRTIEHRTSIIESSWQASLEILIF